jgi:hypothetical protein
MLPDFKAKVMDPFGSFVRQAFREFSNKTPDMSCLQTFQK